MQVFGNQPESPQKMLILIRIHALGSNDHTRFSHKLTELRLIPPIRHELVNQIIDEISNETSTGKKNIKLE